MPVSSRVHTVVVAACRRRFVVVVAEQLALATAVVLGGGILMLLLGTQILDWYWLAALGGIGLFISARRIRERRVSQYRVAQMLDRRLELNDSISTAWFLLTRNGLRGGRALECLQIQSAERLAAELQPERAFPFAGQRAWALAGALAAVAFGLFAVRYLVTSSLSLRQALIPLHFEGVVERIERVFSDSTQPRDAGLGDDPGASGQRPAEAQQNDAQRLLQTPGASEAGTPDPTSHSQVQTPGQSPESQDGKTGQNRESTDGRDGESADGAQPGNQRNSQQNGSQQAANTKELGEPQQNGEQNNQQNSNGLMDRMKDALSGLMAKMRPETGTQKSGNNTPNSGEKKAGEQISSNDEQGTAAQQSATNQQAHQLQNSQGQGQTTEKGQAAQGSSADQSLDKKGSNSQSGIGRQDGDKAIKEAEEQKAMGKLAEIIGKRSASVSGEMTVETASSKQKLQTQYTGQVAAHSDTGGEINRDEIPVEFQQYVRDYMEQIRKQSKNQ